MMRRTKTNGLLSTEMDGEDVIDGSANPTLAALPIFAGLTEGDLEQLVRACKRRVYQPGSYLFLEGDPGNALFVLETGEVRAVRSTPSGREVVLATIGAPAVFGELALIDGAPRSATLVATQHSQVLKIPRSVFLELLDSKPSVRDGLLKTLVALVRAGNDRHADTVGLDASARTAKWLTTRPAHRTTNGDEVVDLGRTQGALAEELGITRVRLNQVLQSFATSGLIEVVQQQVVIHDRASLVSLCR